MKYHTGLILILLLTISACCGKECPTGFHCEETFAGLGAEECVADGISGSSITSLVSSVRLSSTGDIRVYLNDINTNSLTVIRSKLSIRKDGISGTLVTPQITAVTGQEYIILNSPIPGASYYVVLSRGAFSTSYGLLSKTAVFQITW
ncbi:MAG: hypothetical protein OEZ36_01530 [Spirochaetota bacterium]|nr:hypothetical protein [Spirochaetota bacterium]